MKAVVSVAARRCVFLGFILYSMNNSNTNYICIIIDLISTQNVRSEALATFLWSHNGSTSNILKSMEEPKNVNSVANLFLNDFTSDCASMAFEKNHLENKSRKKDLLERLSGDLHLRCFSIFPHIA